ncbi:hypothetical protein MBLNU457_4667t1 [Dothideomycetes sp. NU457]
MADTLTHEVATQYLTSLLNRTLRIHTSDSRIFVGQMKCTDRERNVILGMTHELRWPGGGPPQLEEEAEREVGDEVGKEGGRNKQEMLRRFVGLVVVPGEFITKIEVE